MILDAFERITDSALEPRQRGGAMAAGVQLQALRLEPHFIARLPRGGFASEVPAVKHSSEPFGQLRRPGREKSFDQRVRLLASGHLRQFEVRVMVANERVALDESIEHRM